MKLNYYLMTAGMAVMATSAAYALPAEPTTKICTNPDGTQIEISLKGDAFFHYYHDNEGNILEYDKGWKQTGMKVTAENINLLRTKAYSVAEMMGADLGPTRAALGSDGRSIFPTLADDIHGLVVLMDFPETKFTVPDIRNQVEKLVNEEGYSDYRSCGSARDYYIYNSRGKFAPTFDVSPIVTMDNEPSYYAGSNGWANFMRAAREAVLKLDEMGWDFSKYDYDNDGIIDNVFFFFAGYGQADSKIPGTIWPHKFNYRPYGVQQLGDVVVDGKCLGPYASGMELKYRIPSGCKQPWLDGIGTFTHEFGHVLGLADLYDTDGAGTPEPQDMDIMSTGCYNGYGTRPPMFSAFELWQCRWLEFTDITEPGHYVLPPLTRENFSYRIPVDENGYQFFFVESRHTESWDLDLPDHGTTFWRTHFIPAYWANNGVNYQGTDHLNIVKPDETNSANTWCFGKRYNFSYPGSAGELVPRSKQYADFKVYVTDIKYNEETGYSEFDVNVYTEQGDKVTVLHDQVEVDSDNRCVTLTWDAVDGATDYALTAWYLNRSGKKVYIGGYNETPIGDTMAMLKNLETTVWRGEVHAYVRVIEGLPSTATSNEIVFVPQYFEAGIDGIEADGAEEWYTLTGVRVNPDDVADGIYIVRNGGRSHKVLVTK